MEEHKDAKGKVTGKTGAYRMNEWTPAQKRWAKEVGGLVPGLAHVLKGYGGCPDLIVVSETWQKTWHRAKPRIRLDNVEEDDA